jgi:hypothetical protein
MSYPNQNNNDEGNCDPTDPTIFTSSPSPSLAALPIGLLPAVGIPLTSPPSVITQQQQQQQQQQQRPKHTTGTRRTGISIPPTPIPPPGTIPVHYAYQQHNNNNGMNGANNADNHHSNNMNSNKTIIDFLRKEARLLEQRAQSLRQYADKLDSSASSIHNSSDPTCATTSSSNIHTNLLLSVPPVGLHHPLYAHDPSQQQQHQQQQQHDFEEIEMAPLNENGVPKYKGKKRGRKPKKRKRIRSPNAPKRKHTAYTIFVQETYPKLKAQYLGNVNNDVNENDQFKSENLNSSTTGNGNSFKSSDIIAIVAKQWKEATADQKRYWKHRAQLASMENDEEEEEGIEHEEDNNNMIIEDYEETNNHDDQRHDHLNLNMNCMNSIHDVGDDQDNDIDDINLKLTKPS